MSSHIPYKTSPCPLWACSRAELQGGVFVGKERKVIKQSCCCGTEVPHLPKDRNAQQAPYEQKFLGFVEIL